MNTQDHCLFTGECFEAKMNFRFSSKTQQIVALYFSPKSHIQKYLWTTSHVPNTALEIDNSGMDLCILILLKWSPCSCKVLPVPFPLSQSWAKCDMPVPHT